MTNNPVIQLLPGLFGGRAGPNTIAKHNLSTLTETDDDFEEERSGERADGKVGSASFVSYSSAENDAEVRIPLFFLRRRLRLDPARVMVYLNWSDLESLWSVNSACRLQVSTYEKMRLAKVLHQHFLLNDPNNSRARPRLTERAMAEVLSSGWRGGVSTRGGGVTWTRLHRKLSKPPIALRQGRVERHSQLRPNRFVGEFEAPGVPVLIQHSELDAGGGEALMVARESNWGLVEFASRFDVNVPFRFSDAHGEEITMREYISYARGTQDDSPLPLFDSQFEETKPSLFADCLTTSPMAFSEDLFALLPLEIRPLSRWLIVSPQRSGFSIRKEPVGASAWFHLVSGRKRWCLFPPGVDDDAIGAVPESPDSRSVDKRGGGGGGGGPNLTTAYTSPLVWFSTYWGTPHAMREAVEFVQNPNETVFVPSGWRYVALDLEEGVCLSRNYAAKANAERIKSEARGLGENAVAALEAVLRS